MSDRFEPREGVDYGSCKTCGIAIKTEQDCRTHMADTKPDGYGSSHTISISNPTREGRIDYEVTSIVEDAIREAAEKLAELVHDGDASKEEVTAALRWYSDFDAAFKDEVE